MTKRAISLALSATLLAPMPALALTLEQCERTTHVSHGGERAHRDLGAARVAWTEWWSQEGVYLDLYIAECDTGAVLKARTREERISDRAPFDRTQAAQDVIARHLEASPAFFRLETLAEDLHNIAEDILVAELRQEPCACAAVYPGAKDDLPRFEGLE